MVAIGALVNRTNHSWPRRIAFDLGEDNVLNIVVLFSCLSLGRFLGGHDEGRTVLPWGDGRSVWKQARKPLPISPRERLMSAASIADLLTVFDHLHSLPVALSMSNRIVVSGSTLRTHSFLSF